MLEREIKFHVPAARRDALLQAMQQPDTQLQRLQARYFDTPLRELAASRVALRLRNENGQWVQTAKAPGADPLTRFEHNTQRPDDTLDLTVYKGTPLERTLAGLNAPLAPTYAIDVDRLALRVRHQGAHIELAFDQGVLRAGDISLPILELELELIEGPVAALFSLAETWLQEHGLILELRSKAERGDALAALAQDAGDRAAPIPDTAQGNGGADAAATALPDLSALVRVRRSGRVALPPDAPLAQAYAACASECLSQVIRNAAGLAGIDSQHASDAQRVALVHQLRVGIRRLRACWHLFKPWMRMDDSQQAAELRSYFSLFGESRDAIIVLQDIAPQLLADGMPDTPPPVALPAPALTASLAASAGFQTTLLQLLGQVLSDAPAGARRGEAALESKAESLAQGLTRQLNKWLRQITQEHEQFGALAPAQRHALRKKVKRLRYGLEFSQGLLDAALLTHAHQALAALQSALGELNDLYTAETFYQRLDTTLPGAWFALGWLRAGQRQAAARAEICLQQLTDVAALQPAAR